MANPRSNKSTPSRIKQDPNLGYTITTPQTPNEPEFIPEPGIYEFGGIYSNIYQGTNLVPNPNFRP